LLSRGGAFLCARSSSNPLVCASGFRDTTRIAASSPAVWRDVVLANRKNLCRVLGVFVADLQEFQLALEREDVQAIEEFFTKAKQRRDQWRAQSAGVLTDASMKWGIVS